jgi:holo-[acyl-carrier protein] synthase
MENRSSSDRKGQAPCAGLPTRKQRVFPTGLAKMIVGLGLDVVEIDRIAKSLQRFGGAFVRKVLHEEEIADMPHGQADDARQAAFLAGRFAAKEAAVKALGVGFSQGIGPHSVRVRTLASGKPELFLHGAANDRAACLGAVRAHLSLSHGRDTAAAVVVLESD